METAFRKMDLDSVFPVQCVKDGFVVSKRGDVTIGWEIDLPVAFSLTEGGYDDLLLAFHSAFRILPEQLQKLKMISSLFLLQKVFWFRQLCNSEASLWVTAKTL